MTRPAGTHLARLVAWCGVAALALATWLSLPAFRDGAPAHGVSVCLVDASASVVRTRPAWRAWVERELSEHANAAAASGTDFAVLAYARDVVRCFGPAQADDFVAGDCMARLAGLRDDASDLDGVCASLENAEDLRGRVASLTLLSDGTYNGRDPVARLTALGVAVRWSAPPEATRADLALVALRAPDQIEVGAPLVLAAELTLTAGALDGATEIELDVEVSGASTLQRVVRVALSGEPPWRVRVDLGSAREGLTLVQARARLAGDPTPENDSGAALVRSRGALVVALVARAEQLDQARRWAASAPAGLSVFVAGPEQLSRALEGCDVLVTLDLDPRELPHALVADFVDRQGAWLACGGYEFLAGWAASSDGSLAQSLPLEVDDDGDEREVVVLLDASGSMAGEALEQVRGAASSLVASARPEDSVALRFFTDQLEPSLALGRGGADARDRRAASRALLDARAPSGPTNIERVLEQLAQERAGAEGDALVLLLSDGRDQQPSPRVSELRAQLAQARTELVVIAAGDQADLTYLGTLAGAPDAVRRAPDAASLAEIFAAEAGRGRVRDDGPIELVVAASQPASSALAAELRAALGSSSAAPLSRCLRARARDGDETLLTTTRGEPVLAVRRAGAGWAATWTTQPTARWAPMSSVDALAPVLRALGRAGATSPRPRAAIEGRRIELANVPAEWPASIVARVSELDDAGERRTVAVSTLTPPAASPGLDPLTLRSGSWAPTARWSSPSLELELSGAGAWSTRLPCVAPGAEEFVASPRVAGAVGVPLDRPAAAQLRASNAAQPWLALLGLLALAAGASLGAFGRTAPLDGQAVAKSGR